MRKTLPLNESEPQKKKTVTKAEKNETGTKMEMETKIDKLERGMNALLSSQGNQYHS